MKYTLDPRIWTLAAAYEVTDASGEPRFNVEGSILTGSLTLTAVDGSDVVQLTHKVFALKPTYVISRDGVDIALLTKDFAFFSKEFTLDVPGPNDFTIHGSGLMTVDLTFTRPEDGVVARATAHGAISTSYEVDIEPGQDDALVLAAVVAIDRILAD